MDVDRDNEQSRKANEKHWRHKWDGFEEVTKNNASSFKEYLYSIDPSFRQSFDEFGMSEEELLSKLGDYRRRVLFRRLRPVALLVSTIMAMVSVVMILKPELYGFLVENKFAALLGVCSVIFFVGFVVSYALGFNDEKSFVDIDDKLYSSRVEAAEFERDEALRQLRKVVDELVVVQSVSNESSEQVLRSSSQEGHKFDYAIGAGASDTHGFDHYLKSIIRSLDMNIELADNKASLLLDKGTTYLWRGILFYVLSIVVWQVSTAYFKVGDYAVWGMISCSMTFLVVEFLAAWFLRQYKSFTDSSFNLVRVKSVFNRYFLSYLAIKEFSDSSQDLVDMRVQILKVLEEDVKWLDSGLQKTGDLNHMMAMFESVSGLVEKLKMSSKASGSGSS